jgi:hypothetical protein
MALQQHFYSVTTVYSSCSGYSYYAAFRWQAPKDCGITLTCWALAEEAHIHLIREGLPCDDLHLLAKAPQALRRGLHSQPASSKQQATTVH